MNKNCLILTDMDVDELKQFIREAVFDAIYECQPTQIANDDKKFYTVREVAQKWGVCPQTIWRYAKEKRIKSAKAGRMVRFEKEYIDTLKNLGEVKTPGRTYITKAERNIRTKAQEKLNNKQL